MCMSLAEFQAKFETPSPSPAAFSRRSATASEMAGVCGSLKYVSPWAWRARLDKKSGIITIVPPTGAALYFKIQVGSDAATLISISRKRNFCVQLQEEDLSPCTSGTPVFLTLVDESGQKVRFSVENGVVVSMTSASGKVVHADDYFQRVKNTYDKEGNLVSSYTAAEGLMRTRNDHGTLIMEWYAPAAVTVLENGDYEVSGPPYKTSSYHSYELDGERITTITRRQGNLPPYVIHRTEKPDGSVIISKGTGDDTIIRTILTSQTNGGLIERIESIQGINDPQPVQRTRTLKLLMAGGWLTTSETEAFNTPLARTTIYEYKDECRVSRINRPDGSYTRYDYDSNGREILKAEPWAGGKEKIIRTTYADKRFYDNRPARITESYVQSDGKEITMTTTVYDYEDSPLVEKETKTVTAAGSDQQQVSMKETYGEAAAYPYSAGKTRFWQDISGIQTYYDYEATTEHHAVHKKTAITKANGELAAGQSKKNESFIAVDETVTFEQESVWDGHQWLLLSTAAHEYDEQHRRIKTIRGNGRVSTASWMCCGLLSETDEDGILTSYGYNNAHQLVETIRSEVRDGDTVVTPETITTYTRDALGRVLQTRRDLGPLTMIEYTDYDPLNRVVLQTDVLNRITTTRYSENGLTETVTAPSGATFITEYNTDGSIAHEYGTGQRELYHVYDINNNRLRETVTLADQTTILSQTLNNGFRQTVVQTTPTTVGFFYDRSEYNAKGQLVRTQRDTGSDSSAVSMAPTLYQYDAFGNVTRQIMALSDKPAPDNSPIQEYAYGMENTDNGVCLVTTQTRYNALGSPLASISKQLISQLSPTLETKKTVISERGWTSEEWTEYGENAKRIQKSSIPSSEITAEVVTVDGFALSTRTHADITATATRVYTATGVTLTNTDGRGNATVTVTDKMGRTVSVADAEGNTTAIQYDANHDQPSVVTDAQGNTSCYKYDARGRKTAEWGTAVQPIAFGYDEADRMVSLTTFRAPEEGDITVDPSDRTDGDTTVWTYHQATGLETRKTYADGSHIDKTYDAFNNLATETNARGIVKTFTRETARALLMNTSFSDGTTTKNFAYNHLGQIIQVTDAAGTHNFTYNQYEEPEADNLTMDGHTYLVAEHRDEFGRPAGYRLAAGTQIIQNTGLGYDRQNRVSSLTMDGASAPFTWTYAEYSGLVKKLAYPNGMTRINTYEAKRNFLSVIDYQRPNSDNSPARHEYEYDVLGRPVQRKDTWNTPEPRTTRLLTYNSRSELAGDQLRPGGRFGYQYDNIGNRKEAFEFGDTTRYESNALNQYSDIIKNTEEPFTPAYDADGNQTLMKTSTGIWTVTYNGENRPVKFKSEDGSTIVECAYDYMGRRFKKKVTLNGETTCDARYLYRGYLQIAEFDLSMETPVLTRSYLWDPTEPTATRILAMTRWKANGTEQEEDLYYMHDALKNVTSIFGEGRGRRALYEYRPFGSLITTEGDMAEENKFRFSCEYSDDELGLIYYNYRYFNPTDGRWIQRDPLVEQGGWNLLRFVKNSPFHFIDYTGLFLFNQNQPGVPRPQNVYVSATGNWSLAKRVPEATTNSLINTIKGQVKKCNCIKELQLLIHSNPTSMVVNQTGEKITESNVEQVFNQLRNDDGSSIFCPNCLIFMEACHLGLGKIPQIIANVTGCKVRGAKGFSNGIPLFPRLSRSKKTAGGRHPYKGIAEDDYKIFEPEIPIAQEVEE